MKIHVCVDAALARQYARRGSSILCEIYWREAEFAYPSIGWTDFGASVLTGWSEMLIKLATYTRLEDFRFMDGPFAVRVSYASDRLKLRFKDSSFVTTVTVEDLLRHVLDAAEDLVGALSPEFGGARDVEGLSASIAELKVLAAWRAARKSLVRGPDAEHPLPPAPATPDRVETRPWPFRRRSRMPRTAWNSRPGFSRMGSALPRGPRRRGRSG
jgi:hypothetical protein